MSHLILKRKPSRQMPKYMPMPNKWVAFVFYLMVLLLLSGLAYLAYQAWAEPSIIWAYLVVVALFVLLVFWGSKQEQDRIQRLIQLAQARHGDDIGDFARAFDVRRVNTWVIRAVYEELQLEIADSYPELPQFPIRPDDKIIDLLNDADDFDASVLPRIYQRTGKICRNTFVTEINTVRELVLFVNRLPFWDKLVSD